MTAGHEQKEGIAPLIVGEALFEHEIGHVWCWRMRFEFGGSG